MYAPAPARTNAAIASIGGSVETTNSTRPPTWNAVTTIITHAAVPLAIGLGLGNSRIPLRLLAAGMFASVAPDLDVVAFKLGIAYADAFGHRGASHSLLFALVLALLAAAAAPLLRASVRNCALFVFVATASHALLDMLTNGGLGVALLWPWSEQRFFAPWQFIEVSPLRLNRVFSERGLAVMRSELLWVWLPATLMSMMLWMTFSRARSPAAREN
jgi:inner membrane protein